MKHRASLIACIAACFYFACAYAAEATAAHCDDQVIRVFDTNGDGKVSPAELSAAVSHLAPDKKAAEQQAIAEVAVKLMQDGSLPYRPSNVGAVFLHETNISVGTCLQRTGGHTAECNDPNKDGLIVRTEFRANQVAIHAVRMAAAKRCHATPPSSNAAPSNAAPEVATLLSPASTSPSSPVGSSVTGAAASPPTIGVAPPSHTLPPPPPPSPHHQQQLQQVDTSASVSDTFWNWRGSSIENTRMCDSWIVPLMNDPRLLLLWLRFYDHGPHSSFLDRIDDHVDKLGAVEFAFKWAFVPSYPLLRMVQEQTSAFGSSSSLGCSGQGNASDSEFVDSITAAARDIKGCDEVVAIIRHTPALLCKKETPTGNVFPKNSNGSITLEECFNRTNENSAACFESNDGKLDKTEHGHNVDCIAALKASVLKRREGYIGYLAVFFLFLRVLCEGWSFITLILWLTGTYKTPRFGATWSKSIVKHMLGTAIIAVVVYYAVWNVLPSCVIAAISYIFIYLIWPIGSVLLAYSLVVDGLKPATFAVIKATSPRAKAPCRSPGPLPSKSARDARGLDGMHQQQRPTRRGSGGRAMSPIPLRNLH